MPITTPGDLIAFTLRATGVIGVGQTALAQDTSDAFSALNAMMAMWNRRRWLVYHLIDTSFVSTGAINYSVGPGGNFNIPRQDRLEAAYFRQYITNPPYSVDYPLELLESREDYSQIALKALQSWPVYCFFDSGWPLGYVYPWPVPQASIYELHIVTKDTLSSFLSLTQQINLPPEYNEILWTNLAIRLAPLFQFKVADEIVALAKGGLETIRGSNTQVPRLAMPQGLTMPARYNIFSDQTNS